MFIDAHRDKYRVKVGRSQRSPLRGYIPLGVASEPLLHLQRQRVHPPAHVRHSTGQPHPNSDRNRDHRPATTASTRASAGPCTAASTTTRTSPPSTISMRPVAPVLASSGISTTTGTNPASVSPRLAKSTPPPEQHTAVHSVAARHLRDRFPRAVALRHDAPLLCLAPPPPRRIHLARPRPQLPRRIRHLRSGPFDSWIPRRRPLPIAHVRSFPPVREGGPHPGQILALLRAASERSLARDGCSS